LIVWDLQDAGFPLRSIITFFDPSQRHIRPVFSGMKGGIAICGSNVLLCGNYGDGLIPIDLNESKGRLTLDTKDVLRLGQRCDDGDCFHGHMVGSGKDAIVINTGATDAWLYDIASLGNQPRHEQECDVEDEDEEEDHGNEMRNLRDRSRAIGKISFALRGWWSQEEKEREEA
jgi:hypothetical protein